MAEKIFSADQIEVPAALPKILKGFAKEIIRYNPEDIPQFAIEFSHIFISHLGTHIKIFLI